MFVGKCSDHFVSRMSLTHTLWFLPLEWASVSIFHDTNALRGWRDEPADMKFTLKYKRTELHSHTAGEKTWREECSRRYSYHFFIIFTDRRIFCSLGCLSVLSRSRTLCTESSSISPDSTSISFALEKKSHRLLNRLPWPSVDKCMSPQNEVI